MVYIFMTIGIYKLSFNGTDKVYIGQSIDIAKRYSAHLSYMRCGTSSKKLQEAYSTYGKPTIEILLECEEKDLNDNELEAIAIFNSIENGFNSTDLMYNRPDIRGENSPCSTISNEQAYQVLTMLISEELYTLEQIAKTLGISNNVVKDISAGSSYKWLEKQYPTEYSKLLKLKKFRISGENNKASVFSNENIEDTFKLIVSNPTNCLTSFIGKTPLSYQSIKSLANGVNYKWLATKYPEEYSFMLSFKGKRDKTSGKNAKEQGKSYPTVVSPEGVFYVVENIKAFAREHGLNDSHLGRVLRGLAPQHKGWKLGVV